MLGTAGGQPAKHRLLGTKGLHEPRTSIFSLRYSTLPWQRGKEGLCVFVGILRDFGISMKTLSHYFKFV